MVCSKLIIRIISFRVFAHRSHNNSNLVQGEHPKFGWSKGGIALLSRKPAISMKRGKIGPRLLLTTNRKSHTHFRLVPKSTTLDDWRAITHCVSKRVRLSEPLTKIWIKIDVYFQRRRCSIMTLVSGSIRFMRTFAGIPWRRGVKWQWSNRKRRFSGILDAMSSAP